MRKTYFRKHTAFDTFNHWHYTLYNPNTLGKIRNPSLLTQLWINSSLAWDGKRSRRRTTPTVHFFFCKWMRISHDWVLMSPPLNCSKQQIILKCFLLINKECKILSGYKDAKFRNYSFMKYWWFFKTKVIHIFAKTNL